MKDLTRRGVLKAAAGALGAVVVKAIPSALADRRGRSAVNDTRKTMPPTPAADAFFESRKHLMDHYHAHPRRMPLKADTAAELDTWTAAARAKFIELTGFDRMTPAAANPRRTGAVDCGDFVREHWLIDTEPDVTMPFYLLRPKTGGGPLPAVICCHGHGSGKDSVAGMDGGPDAPGAFGVQFARAGMLAFCPDARGFGQRREADAQKKPGQSSCAYLQLVGLPMGISVVGMYAFDLVRLVDHMQSRDDVRSEAIGCAGFSGGGWQTLAAGIADERLACTVISGYIHPVAAPLLYGRHTCPCNMVPGLWEHFELGDLVGLLAPRPLMVQTGDSDALSGPDGVAEVQGQVDIAWRAYRARGCEDHLVFDVFAGGHQWDGTRAVPWVVKQLSS